MNRDCNDEPRCIDCGRRLRLPFGRTGGVMLCFDCAVNPLPPKEWEPYGRTDWEKRQPWEDLAEVEAHTARIIAAKKKETHGNADQVRPDVHKRDRDDDAA